jgi:hypothetical protein
MNQHESNNEIEFSIVDGGPLDRGLHSHYRYCAEH